MLDTRTAGGNYSERNTRRLPLVVRHSVASGSARDLREQAASAVRCDMVLHRVFRARHPKHKM